MGSPHALKALCAVSLLLLAAAASAHASAGPPIKVSLKRSQQPQQQVALTAASQRSGAPLWRRFVGALLDAVARAAGAASEPRLSAASKAAVVGADHTIPLLNYLDAQVRARMECMGAHMLRSRHWLALLCAFV